MPDAIEKFISKSWLKIIGILVSIIISITVTIGGYHLNKLDGIVKSMQEDKIELIDRIDRIDQEREEGISELKKTVNDINTTLREYIAKTDETRLTTEDALQIWQQIATIKAQIISMDEEIDRIRDRTNH